MDSRRRPLILLVAVVAVAGCAGLPVADPGGTGTPGEGTLATVETVIDGDTLEVRFPDGSTDTVRLLGIDTPETHGAVTPGEYEGVPDTAAGRECLRAAGEYVAHDVVVPRIEGERVTLRGDPEADARGDYGRRLAYVVHGGATLNHDLVERGLARVYEAPLSRLAAFHDAEAAAQAEGAGLWTCRDGTPDPAWSAAGGAGGLVLAAAHPDAAGPDGENLTDEYLVFENRGNATLDLRGWTVRDAAAHVYEVPAGVSLSPGGRLRVVTGSGRDTATTLYWGAAAPVWNNGGDTVTVTAENGTVVLEAPV